MLGNTLIDNSQNLKLVDTLKETFDDKDKRPHFDVSQKQMIVWEDEKELSEKLEKWIKSLFD